MIEPVIQKTDKFDLIYFIPELLWQGMPKRRSQTKEIIIHCTATPEFKDYTIEDIHKFHLLNKWIGIGYNFLIYRDGNIVVGRGEEYIGAHTTDHNSKSIGICYVGGLAKDGKTAKDTRTSEQKEAMFKLCYYLMGKYNLNLNDIHGHYEFANKACPSFKMNTFKSEYLKWVNKV